MESSSANPNNNKKKLNNQSGFILDEYRLQKYRDVLQSDASWKKNKERWDNNKGGKGLLTLLNGF